MTPQDDQKWKERKKEKRDAVRRIALGRFICKPAPRDKVESQDPKREKIIEEKESMIMRSLSLKLCTIRWSPRSC